MTQPPQDDPLDPTIDFFGRPADPAGIDGSGR